MELNQTFKTLLKEATFTKEILGEGATQIRKANYAQKGIYFLSFTSLSTGIVGNHQKDTKTNHSGVGGKILKI